MLNNGSLNWVFPGYRLQMHSAGSSWRWQTCGVGHNQLFGATDWWTTL